MDWAVFFPVIGIVAGTSASVWGLAWWLSGKFSEFNKSFFNEMDSVKREILSKLEYHERHDDTRFSEIRNDIWRMRVDDAARDAAIVLEAKLNRDDEKERNRRSSDRAKEVSGS